MQILLLIAMCVSCAAVVTLGTQSLLPEKRPKQVNFTIGILITVGAAFGTIVAEGILKAGRPTFYYHTHSPGLTTIKIYFLGCLFALIFSALFLLFREKPRGFFPWLVRSVLLALGAALIMELFFFNLRHYELMGLDDKETVSFSDRGFQPIGYYFNRAVWGWVSYTDNPADNYLIFYPNYRKVRNLQFEFEDGSERTKCLLEFDDAAHRKRFAIPEHELINGIPRSYNIPLHTVGKTYSIRLTFPQSDVLKGWNLTINRPIPLTFEPIRFVLTFLSAFLICCFFPGSPLWKIPWRSHSPWQIGIICTLFIVTACFYAWVAFSSYEGSELPITEQKNLVTQNHMQYYWLTDALLARRYALIEEPHRLLEQLDDPYDMYQRESQNFYYPWDTAYYNNRFYVYFGVVPALITFLPWKMLTGIYPELEYPILFFCLLGLLGLYGLYSRIVEKYFKKMNLGLYLSGWIILVTILNLTHCLRRGLVYELAITSGFCFIVWAVFLAMAADDKRIYWFVSGLTASLAVGCRPTLLIVSIVIFVCYAVRIRDFGQKAWLNGMLFFLPYAMVGLALMKYNYERFDNPFEFGIRYQLTTSNDAVAYSRTGISGRLMSMLAYLFTMPEINMTFPFIHFRIPELPYNGFILNSDRLPGIFAYPVTAFLFLTPLTKNLIQKKGKLLRLFSVSAIISALLICFIASGFSITCRYLVDFAWLFGVTALVNLFCCYEQFEEKDMIKWLQSALLFCLLAGLTLFIALSFTGEDNWFEKMNPMLYDRLRYALSPWL